MANYRRRNYSPLQPDPIDPPPMDVPIFDTSECTELDAAAYIVWSYPWKDADTIDGYRVRVAKLSDPSTIIRELYVSEPDTDVIVDQLANGIAYTFTVAAVNKGGTGKYNSGVTLSPAFPKIAAPTLTKLTGGDGQAVAEWKWVEPCRDGHRYEYMSYEAVNEVGATVTEHVTGGAYPSTTGTLQLTNDHDWKVALVAVAANEQSGKEYPSGLSNSMTIHTEKPIAPYKPRLTGAQIAPTNNGQIDVSFAPGIQNITATRPRRWWHRFTSNGRTGPGDITAWQVRVTPKKEPSTPMVYDITDGAVRTYRTEKQALGTYTIDVRAENTVGWSDWSNTLDVTYTPTDKRPFSADIPFGTFESDTYYYAIFDPGNEPSKGWEKTWKCTMTETGKGTAFDIIMVGAGGGGKGQTAALGKGGNGGGGQMNGIDAVSTKEDTFTVFISIGGTVSIDPKDTSVKFNGIETVAFAGKSASSGADATGFPRKYVTDWTDCRTAFGWLEPDSQYVGGVAQEGKQGYPNGLGWGCAGAGTKNSSPGRGFQGIVVIRWAK